MAALRHAARTLGGRALRHGVGEEQRLLLPRLIQPAASSSPRSWPSYMSSAPNIGSEHQPAAGPGDDKRAYITSRIDQNLEKLGRLFIDLDRENTRLGTTMDIRQRRKFEELSPYIEPASPDDLKIWRYYRAWKRLYGCSVSSGMIMLATFTPFAAQHLDPSTRDLILFAAWVYPYMNFFLRY